MKISILVKPNSKKPRIEKLTDGTYHVFVKSPPTEGKANKEVIEMLAQYFDIPKSTIQIVHGISSRKKIAVF